MINKKKMVGGTDAGRQSGCYVGEITLPTIFNTSTYYRTVANEGVQCVLPDDSIAIACRVVPERYQSLYPRVFLQKISRDGQIIEWSRNIFSEGGSGGYDDMYPQTICCDKLGNIYLVATDYPGQLFFAKFSPSGDLLFRTNFAASGVQYIANSFVDSAGYFYFVGRQESYQGLFFKLAPDLQTMVWKYNLGPNMQNTYAEAYDEAVMSFDEKHIFVSYVRMSNNNVSNCGVLTIDMSSGAMTLYRPAFAIPTYYSAMAIDRNKYVYLAFPSPTAGKWRVARVNPLDLSSANDWCIEFDGSTSDIAVDDNDNLVIALNSGTSKNLYRFNSQGIPVNTVSIGGASLRSRMKIDSNGALRLWGFVVADASGIVMKLPDNGVPYGKYGPITLSAGSPLAFTTIAPNGPKVKVAPYTLTLPPMAYRNATEIYVLNATSTYRSTPI